jgi:hypothetical protein
MKHFEAFTKYLLGERKPMQHLTEYQIYPRMDRGSISERAGFSLYVRTDSWAHHLMGTGIISSGIKRPGYEANHSPPSSANAENVWSFTSNSPYAYITKYHG